MNQAYSRLSITHGHVTDCKLDSVVYAGVCVLVIPKSQMGCDASAMGKIQQISSKSCDTSHDFTLSAAPSGRLRRIAEILGIGKPAAVPTAGLKSWRSVARFWSFFGHPRRILQLTTAPSD